MRDFTPICQVLDRQGGKKKKGRLCAIAALSFPVIEVKIKTNSACSFFYI